MANKRSKNREIERKNRQVQAMYKYGFMAAAVAIVLVIAWVVWDINSRNWVIRFEGVRVSTNDLRFLMNDTSPQARQEAVTELLTLQTILHRADMNNVGLTAAERDQWTQDAPLWFSIMNNMGGQAVQIPWITPERLGEFYAANWVLLPRLVDVYVTPEYAEANLFDADIFEERLADYIEQNADNYRTMTLKYLQIENPERAEMVMEQIGTRDFDDLIRDYDMWYDPEWGISTIGIADLDWDFSLQPDQVEQVAALEQGQAIDIVVWDGLNASIFIFYMYERTEAEEEEIRESFRGQFIDNLRFIRLAEMMDGWLEEADFRVNQRAVDAA